MTAYRRRRTDGFEELIQILAMQLESYVLFRYSLCIFVRSLLELVGEIAMDAFDRCTELCFPLVCEGGVESGLVVARGDDAFLVLVAWRTSVGVTVPGVAAVAVCRKSKRRAVLSS